MLGPFGGKGKEKEKKDGPRQTTLFGMMAGPSSTLEEKSRDKKAAPVVDEAMADSQMTDMTMSDVGTLIESQPASQDWQETQVDDSESLAVT
jgi:chromosome transmission fidelity protein 4